MQKIILGCFHSMGPPHDNGLAIDKKIIDEYKNVLLEEGGIDEFYGFNTIDIPVKCYDDIDICLGTYHKVGLGVWRSIILNKLVKEAKDNDIVVINDPNFEKYPGILNVYAKNCKKITEKIINRLDGNSIFSPPHLFLGINCKINVIKNIHKTLIELKNQNKYDFLLKNMNMNIDEEYYYYLFKFPLGRCRNITLIVNTLTREFAEVFEILCLDDYNLKPYHNEFINRPPFNEYYNMAEQSVFNCLCYLTKIFSEEQKWIFDLKYLGFDDTYLDFLQI